MLAGQYVDLATICEFLKSVSLTLVYMYILNVHLYIHKYMYMYMYSVCVTENNTSKLPGFKLFNMYTCIYFLLVLQHNNILTPYAHFLFTSVHCQVLIWADILPL